MKIRLILALLVVVCGLAFAADSHLQQGIALYQQGRLDEAIVELKAAVEASPKDASANCWLGTALMGATRYAEAVACLKVAVESAPTNLVSHQQLALAMEKNGDIAGAIEQSKKVIEIAPNEADWWSHLGDLLALAGNTSEAVQRAKKAVELDPGTEYYLRNLGIHQFQNHDSASAEKTLKAAIAMDASDHFAHAWLAELYRGQGKTNEADAESKLADATKTGGGQAAQTRFILKDLAATWEPSDSEVTKAVVCAEGASIRVFTEDRAGYQVCLKQSRPDGGLLVPKDSETLKELLSRGSVYLFRGKISIWGHDFESDPVYPLAFEVMSEGLVRLCGRGTITTAGKTERVGYNDSVDGWLSLAGSTSVEERTGAVCALGWLAKTSEDKDKAVPALADALADTSMSVRRFASESLAVLGDPRGIRLLIAVQGADEQTQSVAQESLGLLKIHAAVAKLPDGVAFTVLEACLADKSPLVRMSAAQSLGASGDPRGADALKKALADEKNSDAKAAMEAAITKLGK